MKKVLIVHYSQSGQLDRAARAVARPLEDDPAVEVVYERLQPEREYPFPWSFMGFMDAFPESVHLDPPAMKPPAVNPATRFDLVILAYQVWFLSPSLPVTGFLKSDAGRRLLEDTPVVTLVACRNMWLCAQEKVQMLLDKAGARHLDHIALVDRGHALASFITTPRWVLTGRRGGDGWLPRAGVSDRDIESADRFGRALSQALADDRERGNAPLLTGLEAVNVDERLIASERMGHRSFLIWGRLLRMAGPPGSTRRKPLLVLYSVFLVAMILTLVPITMLLRLALYPVLRPALRRRKRHFEQPSGSGSERMEEFAGG